MSDVTLHLTAIIPALTMTVCASLATVADYGERVAYGAGRDIRQNPQTKTGGGKLAAEQAGAQLEGERADLANSELSQMFQFHVQPSHSIVCLLQRRSARLRENVVDYSTKVQRATETGQK